MNRRNLLLGGAVIAFLAVGIAMVLGGGESGGPSTLSSRPEGWRAARLILERSGAEVTLLGEPPAAGVAPVVLTALPWSGGLSPLDVYELERHAREGGTLVVAYGQSENPVQSVLLSSFGLVRRDVRRKPPLAFRAWQRHVRQRWVLPWRGPDPGGRGAEPAALTLPALSWVPSSIDVEEVLYRLTPELQAEARRALIDDESDDDESDDTAAAQPEAGSEAGWPVVFSLRVGEGRVVMLPAVALDNARLLDAPGNADLLATLAAWLGDSWAIDEYHHGLVVGEEAAGQATAGYAFDLFGIHLLVLYLLGLVALGRRFGPPWREEVPSVGSAASFLRGLGAMHHKLGHHAEAAGLLLRRTADLDQRFEVTPELAERAEKADGKGLVALAREVARRRGEVGR